MFNRTELNHFYRYCVALTGDADSAFDLLHGCIEKLMQRNHGAIKDLKRYFLRMIRNQFFDDLRKKGMRPTDEFDENKSIVAMGSKSLEDIVADRHEVERIMGLLAPGEREILFLWAVEEFTVQNIADHLGQPKGTVLSKLYRLKAKIRSKLGRGRKAGQL
jgi:RNA polymerase sigma-70 factor, ECF subfamily